jgi:hypothetical protein
MDEREPTSVAAAALRGAINAVPMVPLLFVRGPIRIAAGAAASALFIRFIVRGLNHRDAPIARPTAQSSGSPADSTRFSIGFGIFRAAFVTAAVWCTSVLATALYVRVPGKGRPGTFFSDDVAPTILAGSFCLFFVGAIWCSSSVQARDSDVIKSCVYLAFVDMIVAQLLALQVL